ncbi:hypothetical protein SAMN02745206_03472 [Desulfacinum infernum DSM 9756]|uniref:Glycosyl transferase family 2 n=1 Tax=Desulfacinum infernum DSM 9756 TaxID=1121391 RepID=A0A1M5HYH8_9BACT|nr:hypothetical protein [Desulfacinum infernum]SHG21081.1 hypothetical protein SAMN02745206_03472 [Desulfacinum infernum DSM 9756]
MLFQLKKKIKHMSFDLYCRGILETPPLKTVKGGPYILSLVCHTDLIMYLVAIKSLYSSLKMGEVVVIDDGTLTHKDKNILSEHVSPSMILHVDSVYSDETPDDVSWKRLLHVVELVQNNYVIQVDSDTVTLGPVSEVVRAVAENRSFTLGTWKGQKIERMKVTVDRVKEIEGNHVQVVAEKNFEKLKRYEELNYVRGCAAFAGFGSKSFSLEEVESFSGEMKRVIGEKWRDWGSEQVTTNYLVANVKDGFVLPFPKYSGYRPDANYDSVFLHFVGSQRFKDGAYVRCARKVIEGLKCSP